jgi:hypothetical protein
METITEVTPSIAPRTTQSQVALHLMINQISVGTMPTAMRKRSILVNDIPLGLKVNADAHKLAAVIGTLLHTVICHTNDSYIRISAKRFHNVTLLHIKENSRLNSPAFASRLCEIQTMAEAIGGSVGVTSYRNEVTTIALSMVDRAA